jgi:RNA polymerase sigma-70 factor (ECF subfamily)
MLPFTKKQTQGDIATLPLKQRYSDFELVAGLKAADMTISAAFFDQYNDKINKLVWKLLGNDLEHNDIVNNIFLDIMTSIKTIRNPEALPKWVSSVTLNAVRRELRNRKYRRFFTPLNSTADEHDIQDTDHSRDLYGRIFKVIRTMSADNHIIFALRFIEGYTFEEIADIKNCSLITAKRHAKKSREEFMKKAQTDLVLRSFVEDLKK